MSLGKKKASWLVIAVYQVDLLASPVARNHLDIVSEPVDSEAFAGSDRLALPQPGMGWCSCLSWEVDLALDCLARKVS